LAGIRVNRRVARALPSSSRKMTLTPAHILLSLLFLLAISSALTAQTFDVDSRNKIRPTSWRLIPLPPHVLSA